MWLSLIIDLVKIVLVCGYMRFPLIFFFRIPDDFIFVNGYRLKKKIVISFR